jgi:hypothetical protein
MPCGNFVITLIYCSRHDIAEKLLSWSNTVIAHHSFKLEFISREREKCHFALIN